MSKTARAIEWCYLVARGGVHPKTLHTRDQFKAFGRRQLYWKGRADAASDIRQAAEAIEGVCNETDQDQVAGAEAGGSDAGAGELGGGAGR